MKRRMLSLAAFAALLFVTTAFAAKGGSQTTANMLFDDLAGDAIQSDGLGAYPGAIRGRDGSLLISTGERSLLIDFGWGDGVREIVGMTIDVDSLKGDLRYRELRASGWSLGHHHVRLGIAIGRHLLSGVHVRRRDLDCDS